jgi:hypothetical protein
MTLEQTIEFVQQHSKHLYSSGASWDGSIDAMGVVAVLIIGVLIFTPIMVYQDNKL